MNKDITRKWVEALRSGEYKQTSKRLKSQDGAYCCLGVLCDLYAKEHPESGWKPLKSTSTMEDKDIPVPFFDDLEGRDDIRNVSTAMPSSNVTKWLGADSSDAEFFINNLAVLNDRGTSFEGIANLIEKKVEIIGHE